MPNSRTLYCIASVSKVVTGIMLLQLVERGVVHLTDPVERYVPEFKKIPNPYRWSPPVTLMQLATMTSGLEDKTGPDCQAGTKWDTCLLTSFSSMAYASEPGTQRGYCNAGYAILGLALSRAANRTSRQANSYKMLVREALKILNPTSPGGSGLQPLEKH